MKKIFYSIILILISVVSCKSQEKNSEETQFKRVFPKKEYLADIDELSKALTKTHPFPYQYISEKEFWDNVSNIKKQITDTTTLPEFIWHCSEIVASIGCSHTTLGAFLQESKLLPVEKLFPLELRLINGKMYVTNSLVNNEKVELGSELVSINGVSTDEIRKDIFKHIPADGEIDRESKKKYFKFFSPYYIAYSLRFPEKYEIQLKSEKSKIHLNQLKEYEFSWDGKSGYSNQFCDDLLCFEIMKSENLAILTMRTFFYDGDDLDNYRELIKESFKKIKKDGISNLIIDLRGNGGGQSFNGAYLLRYLISEPITYFIKGTPTGEERMKPMNHFEYAFTGDTYILQDAGCGSTTGHFLSLIKYNKLATIIGEESGGTYLCNDGSRTLRLQNTGVSCRIARVTFTTTAKNLPRERGVIPDKIVVQNINDYINNIDTVLNYTLKLIKDK